MPLMARVERDLFLRTPAGKRLWLLRLRRNTKVLMGWYRMRP